MYLWVLRLLVRFAAAGLVTMGLKPRVLATGGLKAVPFLPPEVTLRKAIQSCFLDFEIDVEE